MKLVNSQYIYDFGYNQLLNGIHCFINVLCITKYPFDPYIGEFIRVRHIIRCHISSNSIRCRDILFILYYYDSGIMNVYYKKDFIDIFNNLSVTI